MPKLPTQKLTSIEVTHSVWKSLKSSHLSTLPTKKSSWSLWPTRYNIHQKGDIFVKFSNPVWLQVYSSFCFWKSARWTENFVMGSTERSYGIYPECRNVVVCCCCRFLTTRSSSSSSCLGPECPDFMEMTAKDKLLFYIWIYCRIGYLCTPAGWAAASSSSSADNQMC